MNKLEKYNVWCQYSDHVKLWLDYYVTITDEKERAMVLRFIKETSEAGRTYDIENGLTQVD